jgi:hypothetical protein
VAVCSRPPPPEMQNGKAIAKESQPLALVV